MSEGASFSLLPPCPLAPCPRGGESFTRWLAPGSKLGASWSEGSETNVILGFRVPTTIGLRKPGSPCSQLAPLAPRASLGPWSLWGARGYGQGGSKLKLDHMYWPFRTKHPPKVKYFLLLYLDRMYWPFRTKHPPKVKYFLLL